MLAGEKAARSLTSRTRRQITLCFAAVVAITVLAACGHTSPRGEVPIRIAIDFTPNPAHAPLYIAARDGYDRRFGVRFEIRAPGQGPNSLQLLLADKVDIGVLDINDLGLARERHEDLVGIAALVQQPLGALITLPSIKRPRDLEGKNVGVSGLPSDPAFLRAVLSKDGASLSRVHQVTIGFNAVEDLLTRRIAGVPAFWSDEGVTLRLRGLPVQEFRINQYGAPNFPEVVLVVRRSTLRQRRVAIVHALAAIALGANTAVAKPNQAAAAIDQAQGAPDARLVLAKTLALRPALVPPLRLNKPVLEAWARFDAETGLLPRLLAINDAFDFSLADEALRLAKQSVSSPNK
jgi:NitT/TauT family transport system substrate-binding protein/putative hydroxymethylpyrimidine transport system substrate-binding protein